MINFLIFVFVLKLTSAQQQFFLENPKNTSVQLGEDVVLKCTVKNQKGELVWCKEESFCTFGRKRNFTDTRLSIGGDESKGEHNLIIKNVSLIDDTKYQCQVTATDTAASIKSDFAYLTVLIKPSSISIVSNNKADNTSIRLITNQTTTLECIVENSNPGCSIKWYLDSKELVANNEISGLISLSKKQLNRLFKTNAKINIRPATIQDWQNKYLKCECNNDLTSLSPTGFSDSKIISVNYAPIVKIEKISQEDLVNDLFIQFECISDSQPPVSNYKWYIDDIVYSNGMEEKFLNLKIETKMNKKLLKCDAKNEVSTQTASYLIELTYGPKFKADLPSHKVVNLNEQLSLSCEIDSHPQASIIWTLNDTVIYAYPKLIINSFKPENYGLYKCIASLKDFPRVSSSTLVLPPGPPIIESNAVQYGYFGEPGSIECTFEKEPKPNQIEWYKNGAKIDFEKESNIRLRTDQIDRKGSKSVLMFKEILENDFNTNYTCKGINFYGSKSFNIILEPKIKELGSTFSIIIIFVFLFSIGIILGFLAYFKFNKISINKKRFNKIKYKKNHQTLTTERLKSKPSLMLNANAYRHYKRYPRCTKQMINRLKNQKRANGGNYYSELGGSFDIVNPLNLTQSKANSLENFNYLNYEYGPAINNKSETAETSFNDPIEAEYNYLNTTQYHTDV